VGEVVLNNFNREMNGSPDKMPFSPAQNQNAVKCDAFGTFADITSPEEEALPLNLFSIDAALNMDQVMNIYQDAQDILDLSFNESSFDSLAQFDSSLDEEENLKFEELYKQEDIASNLSGLYSPDSDGLIGMAMDTAVNKVGEKIDKLEGKIDKYHEVTKSLNFMEKIIARVGSHVIHYQQPRIPLNVAYVLCRLYIVESHVQNMIYGRTTVAVYKSNLLLLKSVKAMMNKDFKLKDLPDDFKKIVLDLGSDIVNDIKRQFNPDELRQIIHSKNTKDAAIEIIKAYRLQGQGLNSCII